MAEFTQPAVNPVVPALERLLARLEPVAIEVVDSSAFAGRVLAEAIRADRDSPPRTVSAMDGYACRSSDLAHQSISVAGEVHIGQAPVELPAGQTLRIFTGGCVPNGAELVIRREEVEEAGSHIVVRDPASHRAGECIRRQGENLKAGDEVLPAGTLIHTPAVAALASFGRTRVQVFRRVRVSVLITGDELLPPEAAPQPWQIRDSNGPALHAMLSRLSWVELKVARRVIDDLQGITTTLANLLAESDAVFLTGGVSMGDYDHVPAAVEATGGEIVFHRLPIRPGKPVLGAVGPQGQAILGLPGNPVSVMVTARRLGWAVLRQRGGFLQPMPSPTSVRVDGPLKQATGLWWYQPVQLLSEGLAATLANMGSGDVAAAARSDGFIEVAPAGMELDRRSLPFWGWDQ